MKRDDVENRLRGLKYVHLTEAELVAYCDGDLSQMRRARVEAHLKQCFICERQLAQLHEENTVLKDREITSDDIVFIEQLMNRVGMARKPAASRAAGKEEDVSLRERLAESLRQMVASWRLQFARQASRGATNPGKEVWRWQSDDGLLGAHAILEKNGDLTVHFSSSERGLEGVRLRFRLGPLSREVTLSWVSESEVYAGITVPRRQRPRKLADISVESF